MKDDTYLQIAKVLLLLSGLYVILRSYFLVITFDEALTYLDYVTKSYIAIFTEESIANNHFLNTVLIKFFVDRFGVSEFVLRIPALIGAAIYLTTAYYISKLLFKNIYFLASVLLLITSPLIMDFLPIARGYSLALGFFMVALYYFLKEEHAEIVILMATLSVLSVLSFLYVYAALLLLLVVRELILIRFDVKSLIVKVVLPSGISLSFLYLTLFGQVTAMQKGDQFYFGGTVGFWQDTIWSIINYNLYENKYLSVELFQAIVILTIAILLLLIAYGTREKQLMTICSLIFLLIMLINIHHLMGTRFILDRAAIFFVPLFAIMIIHLWNDSTVIAPKYSRIINTFFIVILIIFSFNFLQSINLTHTLQWKFEADLDDVINEIRADETNSSDQKSIGATWYYYTGINFYRIKYNMTWLKPATRDGVDGIYDYYLAHWEDKSILDKYNITYKYYPVSNSYFGIGNNRMSSNHTATL